MVRALPSVCRANPFFCQRSASKCMTIVRVGSRYIWMLCKNSEDEISYDKYEKQSPFARIRTHTHEHISCEQYVTIRFARRF